MKCVDIKGDGDAGVLLAIAVRSVLTGVERLVLTELKRDISQYMQAGQSPEAQWINQGLVMALNVISDREARL